VSRKAIYVMVCILLCAAGLTTFLKAAEPVKTGEKRDTLLYVRTDPPGAKVLINGKEAGTSDGLFRVEPRSGTILVELEGRKPDKRQVIIRANAITRVEMSLDPKQGPIREQKFEPKSGAAVDSPGPHFVGNLPQGSVELIGVTHYPPTEQSKWWKPDGSPVELGTFLPQTSHGPSHPHENSVSILFRFRNLPADTSRAWKTTPPAGWWADDVVDGQGKALEGYGMLCPDFNETVKTAGFHVGIDGGSWETVITQKPDRLGSSSFSRAGRESTVSLLKAEARESAGEDSTRVTLMSNEPYGQWRRRLVAVTKDSTEHATRIDYMESNGTADFRGLRPSSITELRYQVRPFVWVEFKNVSLQPGEKTEVVVVSADKPAESDEQPATNP